MDADTALLKIIVAVKKHNRETHIDHSDEFLGYDGCEVDEMWLDDILLDYLGVPEDTVMDWAPDPFIDGFCRDYWYEQLDEITKLTPLRAFVKKTRAEVKAGIDED